jgi:hypothetical protein
MTTNSTHNITHNITKIGVLGAGQMGGGIAQVAACRRFSTSPSSTPSPAPSTSARPSTRSSSPSSSRRPRSSRPTPTPPSRRISFVDKPRQPHRLRLDHRGRRGGRQGQGATSSASSPGCTPMRTSSSRPTPVPSASPRSPPPRPRSGPPRRRHALLQSRPADASWSRSSPASRPARSRRTHHRPRHQDGQDPAQGQRPRRASSATASSCP